MTVRATPNSGFRFRSWAGTSCAGKGATCTFAASGDRVDTASFVAIETVKVAGGTGGNGLDRGLDNARRLLGQDLPRRVRATACG